MHYFSAAHYLVLTCQEDVQSERLKSCYPQTHPKPPSEETIAQALNGNRYITQEAEGFETATVLDTTYLTVVQTLDHAESWITDRL